MNVPINNDNLEDEEIICHCGQVSRRALLGAISNGKNSVRALRDALGAAVACMGCVDEIEEMIAENKIHRHLLQKRKLKTHPSQSDFFLPDE